MPKISEIINKRQKTYVVKFRSYLHPQLSLLSEFGMVFFGTNKEQVYNEVAHNWGSVISVKRCVKL